MPGDVRLGSVLRELRHARRLTLLAVAQQAPCAESLMSSVETGQRQLQTWLADRLDVIYETGGMITALANDAASRRHRAGRSSQHGDDIMLIHLPDGGVPMPVSRRALLAGLGVGVLSGPFTPEFINFAGRINVTPDTLERFEKTLVGLQKAARSISPIEIINPLISQVATMDAVRRRTEASQRRNYLRLQARYAESISWLSEEAGDAEQAHYWLDRTTQWAQAASWLPMVAYTFVRRSMMAISFASDGHSAIEHAHMAMEFPSESARIRGLAAKQVAFGHALTGSRDECLRSLDTSIDSLSIPSTEEDEFLGQRSVASDELYSIYRTTCDTYLGHSRNVISSLEPRIASLANSSVRTATITRAKLARAYANAGQPYDACRIADETIRFIDEVGSLSARSELLRLLSTLNKNWPRSKEVRDLTFRLRSS